MAPPTSNHLASIDTAAILATLERFNQRMAMVEAKIDVAVAQNAVIDSVFKDLLRKRAFDS